MSKTFKSVTILVIGALISMSVSLTALGASEKHVDIQRDGGSIVVSNVVEETTAGSFPLLIADAPATVTFDSANLSREMVLYLPGGKIENGELLPWGEDYADVQFDVKKYIHFQGKEVFDELVQASEEMPYYLAGNQVTLSKPGIYYVNGATEPDEGTSVIVQITGGAAAVENTTAPLTAKPAASSVLVNGKATVFEAYNIEGNNYFKLRDLAMAVNGTAKNFEVGWDSAKNAINLTFNNPYKPNGSELTVSPKLTAKPANPTGSKVLIEGQEVEFTAFNIDGNNYFKLRDIAQVMDLGVTWDGQTSTIGIDTEISYTE